VEQCQGSMLEQAACWNGQHVGTGSESNRRRWTVPLPNSVILSKSHSKSCHLYYRVGTGRLDALTRTCAGFRFAAAVSRFRHQFQSCLGFFMQLLRVPDWRVLLQQVVEFLDCVLQPPDQLGLRAATLRCHIPRFGFRRPKVAIVTTAPRIISPKVAALHGRYVQNREFITQVTVGLSAI